MQTEAEKLLNMEEVLHERIIGQDEAIQTVSDAIRRARSGLKDPRRPAGGVFAAATCSSRRSGPVPSGHIGPLRGAVYLCGIHRRDLRDLALL